MGVADRVHLTIGEMGNGGDSFHSCDLARFLGTCLAVV